MIRVRELHKTYPASVGLLEALRRPLARRPGVHALCGVDVDVEAGDVFGLLGPNGAGKTTLQKILVNLVLPSSGRVEVAGHPIRGGQCEVRRLVGWVPSDERSFFWRLSGLQNLRFFAALFEIPARTAEERIRHYLELFDLTGAVERPFATYSAGRKKLLTIIRALLPEPPILVFDEATNSLDPTTARRVKALVRDELAGAEGRSVVWATHRLEEVREVCDRVMLIDRGRSRFCGSVAELLEEARRRRLDEDASLTQVFEELVGP